MTADHPVLPIRPWSGWLDVPMRRKVPEITALFWIVKVLTTAMGEVTSDYLVHQIEPVIAAALGGVALLAALVVQLNARRYVPWVYWLAVVMVAVFGTMAADGLHVELGIPYLVSTVGFAAALLVIFATWYRSEGTLSIHTIDTRRRELFYWATVLATFALGTAAGDMVAATVGLGYFGGGVLFAILIVLPAIAYRWFGLDTVTAFWTAYVLTRPLGASFADWLGRSTSVSGLGLGTGLVGLVLGIVIVILVGYISVTRADAEPDQR